MFNNEIIELEKELTALKAASRRTITNGSLTTKTVTVTSNMLTDGNLNQAISLKIRYFSDNPPVMMVCIQRDGGNNLLTISQDTYQVNEVDKIISNTIIPNYWFGTINDGTITLRFTVYSLSDIEVNVGALD